MPDADLPQVAWWAGNLIKHSVFSIESGALWGAGLLLSVEIKTNRGNTPGLLRHVADLGYQCHVDCLLPAAFRYRRDPLAVTL